MDTVLISHLHLDHLHLPSLRRLGPVPRLVVPAGAGIAGAGAGGRGGPRGAGRRRGRPRRGDRAGRSRRPLVRSGTALPDHAPSRSATCSTAAGCRPTSPVTPTCSTACGTSAGSTWPSCRSGAGARRWASATSTRPAPRRRRQWIDPAVVVPIHWGTYSPVRARRGLAGLARAAPRRLPGRAPGAGPGRPPPGPGPGRVTVGRPPDLGSDGPRSDISQRVLTNVTLCRTLRVATPDWRRRDRHREQRRTPRPSRAAPPGDGDDPAPTAVGDGDRRHWRSASSWPRRPGSPRPSLARRRRRRRRLRRPSRPPASRRPRRRAPPPPRRLRTTVTFDGEADALAGVSTSANATVTSSAAKNGGGGLRLASTEAAGYARWGTDAVLPGQTHATTRQWVRVNSRGSGQSVDVFTVGNALQTANFDFFVNGVTQRFQWDIWREDTDQTDFVDRVRPLVPGRGPGRVQRDPAHGGGAHRRRPAGHDRLDGHEHDGAHADPRHHGGQDPRPGLRRPRAAGRVLADGLAGGHPSHGGGRPALSTGPPTCGASR